MNRVKVNQAAGLLLAEMKEEERPGRPLTVQFKTVRYFACQNKVLIFKNKGSGEKRTRHGKSYKYTL